MTKYLPPMNGPWGYRRDTAGTLRYIEEKSPQEANEYALRDMCDTGAAEVAAGKADALEFRLMPHERDYVADYMSDKHPTIQFRMTWPSWKAD